MTYTLSPRDVGIPHPEWRPNQYSMYIDSLGIMKAGGGFLFGEMSTGSGKSGVATALGHHTQVTVLVHTLGLLDQYAEKYGFEIIKGRQEYSCVHPDKILSWSMTSSEPPTALDCHYEKMTECPFASRCSYLIQKHKALRARRMACTYRYAAVSYNVQTRAGVLVLDEAHDAVEELIALNEFAINNKTIRKYSLPEFPIVAAGNNGKGGVLVSDQLETVKQWVRDCISRINSFSEDEMNTPEGSRITRLKNRMARLLISLTEEPYFFSLFGEHPALRALNAKDVAARIFANKSTILLMSATIGDPAPLASELGIEDYIFKSYPHPVPAEFRPVFNLNGPSMTHRKLQERPEGYAKQAVVIANFIKKFNPDYRGAVLTTSFWKIKQLKFFLPQHIQGRRFIIQEPGKHLSTLVNRFMTDTRKGDIVIGTMQGWGSGLDFYGDIARWIVVAGVPHQNPTDAYGKARRAIAGGEKYQMWRTYNAVMQACGRVSRGELNYDGSIMKNYAALADASCMTKKAQRYYSPWFTEAIV